MEVILKLFQGCGFCQSTNNYAGEQAGEDGKGLDQSRPGIMKAGDPGFKQEGLGSFRNNPKYGHNSHRRDQNPRGSQQSIDKNGDPTGKDLIKQMVKEHAVEGHQKSKRGGELALGGNVQMSPTFDQTNHFGAGGEKSKMQGLLNAASGPKIANPPGADAIDYRKQSFGPPQNFGPLRGNQLSIGLNGSGDANQPVGGVSAQQSKFPQQQQNSDIININAGRQEQTAGDDRQPIFKKGTFSGAGLALADGLRVSQQQQQPGAVAVVAKDAPSNNQTNIAPRNPFEPQPQQVTNISTAAKPAGKYQHMWLMNDPNNVNKMMANSMGNQLHQPADQVSKKTPENQSMEMYKDLTNHHNPKDPPTSQPHLKLQGSEEGAGAAAGMIDKKSETNNAEGANAPGKLQLLGMKQSGTTNNLLGKAKDVNQVKKGLRNMLF